MEPRPHPTILGPSGQPYHEKVVEPETRPVPDRDELIQELSRAALRRESFEPSREQAEALGLDLGEIAQMSERFEDLDEWFVGGSIEQRQSVAEALINISLEGKINTNLLEALLVGVRFTELTAEGTDETYGKLTGKIMAGARPDLGEIHLAPDLDPRDAELRHILGHELGHLIERAINYDDRYARIIADRNPALDSQYVRDLRASLGRDEPGKPTETQSLAVIRREQFAEDFSLFSRSNTEFDFLRLRLEQASEPELERLFGDTKTLNETVRLLRSNQPLPYEGAYRKVINENRELYQYFSRRTESIRGMDREELTGFIEEREGKTDHGYEPSRPVVDTEALATKPEAKSSWLDLLLALFLLIFRIPSK